MKVEVTCGLIDTMKAVGDQVSVGSTNFTDRKTKVDIFVVTLFLVSLF